MSPLMYDPEATRGALTLARMLLSSCFDQRDQGMEMIHSLDERGRVCAFVSKIMAGGEDRRDAALAVLHLYGYRPRGSRSPERLVPEQVVFAARCGIPVSARDLRGRSFEIAPNSLHNPETRERLAHVLAAWLHVSIHQVGVGGVWPGDDPRQGQLFGGAA